MRENRKIAIYLRLSIEDDASGGRNYKESNSISNQRKMLMEYISNDVELKEQEVAEFCDDADIIGLNQKTLDLRGFTD